MNRLASMMLPRIVVALVAILCTAACGGPGAPKAPDSASREIAAATMRAFQSEALDAPEVGIRRWLDVVELAKDGVSPIHIAAIAGAVDALVGNSLPPLERVTSHTALVYRAAVRKDAVPETQVETALRQAATDTKSGAVRELLGRGLELMYVRRGDAKSAAAARGMRACAPEIVVMGPLDWPSLSALQAPSSLAAFDAPLPEATVTPGAFGRRTAPVVVGERGCEIDFMAPTAEAGVREIVVDIEVPRAQTIGVQLRAMSAAKLRVGGKDAFVRSYEQGSGLVTHNASVEAERGRLRVVVRTAGEEPGMRLGISAWDEEGAPLAIVAPKPGSRGTARATAVSTPKTPEPRGPSERLTFALGALALSDVRAAERIVITAPANERGPELELVYARALEDVLDIPQVQRAERARTAVGKVLDKWPAAPEAIMRSAMLGAVRRGEGEAQIEALREIAERRAKGAASPMLDAFEAAWAGLADLQDRAEAALVRFEAAAPGSVLANELRAFVDRAPLAARAKTLCSSPSLDRAALDCYAALRVLGDHEGAKRELERLRALAGSPRLYGPMAIRDALAANDLAAAKAELARAMPGERSINATFTLRDSPSTSAEGVRDLLSKTLVTSRESAGSLGPLLSSVGDDRLKSFEGVAERLVAEDKKKRVMPEAATVVLSHTERYEVDASGILHAVLHDVRRVGGTTDVEQNAQADAPTFLGRASLRAVVRRILKADGRILLPDQTPGAAQSHADLSQLGPGDVVEALYEGWALPNETFDIGFDTPDLLPDRTAVATATVEITVPAALKASMHVHPQLGKASTREERGMRVMSWTLKDQPARRFEEGVPKMDRSVGVSLTTVTWNQIGRALGETIRALDENDPEVAVWARTAARGLKPSPELLSAVVTAAGDALRQPAGALLSDYGVGRAGARQTMTARTFLAEREGSRTWLVARALRELGVPTEIIVAEQEPYSTDPEFPARFGRFVHPLLVARVPAEGGKTKDFTIDADVNGPPLPPGHISPELRGRKVLHADGTIGTLPVSEGDERDELDLRLTVDKKGDARGSFTAVLRGRAAQELADAFTRIVGDERQRALRNVVLGYVPGANVDLVVLSSSEGSWQIALRADISVGGFAQQEKNKKGDVTWVVPGLDPVHYVFPRAFVTTVASAYASRGARQNALAVERAMQYHLRRRIELPQGAKVVRSPGPLRHDGSLLHAERTVSGGTSLVEDDFVLGVRTGTVAREEYGAFVDAARRIDESFLASTRLTW